MAEFELGQIFVDSYPPEAAEWCNLSGLYHIEEIESLGTKIDYTGENIQEDEDGNAIDMGVEVPIPRYQIMENEIYEPDSEDIAMGQRYALLDNLPDILSDQDDAICSLYEMIIDSDGK